MKTTLSLLTATALILGCLSTASVGASLTNCGRLTVSDDAQNGVTQDITQSNPTDLNGSAITINVGGSAPSCVIVDFSAQASIFPGNMFVRAILDNTDVSVDGKIILTQTGQTGTYGYNFLFTDVPLGSHTVKMQVWVTPDGNGNGPKDGVINDFNMVVRHR